MPDYSEIVRRSIRKEFARCGRKREIKTPHPKNTRRVISLNERSEYARFKRFIVGKLVRILESGNDGGYWVQFVRDDDRLALNAAAGWSENKNRYLLDGVKFDD